MFVIWFWGAEKEHLSPGNLTTEPREPVLSELGEPKCQQRAGGTLRRANLIQSVMEKIEQEPF